MNVSRRRIGWLAGIVIATAVAGFAACKDSSSPLPGPRMDEVPCAPEDCPTNDSIPTFYASPAIYQLDGCYVQEADLGFDVVLPSGCPSGFGGGDQQLVVSYRPYTQPDIGQTAVSALYELNYTDATHYHARMIDTVIYGHEERVFHTATIRLEANAAGVRLRSFNRYCPSNTMTAADCWHSGGGDFNHDELHICIPNYGSSYWNNPEVYCIANSGDDAATPIARSTATWQQVDPLLIISDYFPILLDGTQSNRTPSAYHWEVYTSRAPDCTPGTWTEVGIGATYATGLFALLQGTWSVRLRVVDSTLGIASTQVALANGTGCQGLTS